MIVKKYKLLILFSLSAWSLSAQLNLGMQASYLQTFFLGGEGHPGFGLRGEVGVSEEVAIQVGFHYFFSANYFRDLEGIAISSLTAEQVVTIHTISTVVFTDYYVGVKYYLSGKHSTLKKASGVGVYIAGDFGVVVAGFETTADSTNSLNWSLYTVPVKEPQLGAFTYLSLNPSIGVERMFGSIYGYTELKAYVQVYETSSSGLKFETPYTFNFNIGIRIPFGGEY
ncbi:MAG: hypothetical protein ACJA0Q_000942 [Saprospiraceae bacterium]